MRNETWGTSGEPFMGQTKLDGQGRILYLTQDVWPNFISCVLAVNEDAIRNRRADVQARLTRPSGEGDRGADARALGSRAAAEGM